jgi:hypothetical protein
MMTDRETKAKTNSGASSVADTLLRLESTILSINKKLDDNVDVLTKSIEKCKNEFREEFQSEIVTKIKLNFANIEANAVGISDLQADANRIDDTIDANNRANDLLIIIYSISKYSDIL